MSKRRINKQQALRIEKIQQSYHQDQRDNLADGLVITRFSKHVEIEDHDKKRILCSIRPNIDTLVAGDRVIWQPEGIAQGVVVSVYPRASMLARPTAGGVKKLVAANITQIVVVIAPKPEISWPLLDSYLIMAETLQLHAIIVFNKTDILPLPLKQEFLKHYQDLGYPILFISRDEAETYAKLKEMLNHQVSVFVGQSGVGKSSLIGGILPHEEAIVTNSISEIAQLGRHTTSNSRYYHLPSGGALVDSPGVREFSLWSIDPDTLISGYCEFRPFINQCKFRNCTHINSPHCGLIAAVNAGQLSSKRYENYIKLRSQFSNAHSTK